MAVSPFCSILCILFQQPLASISDFIIFLPCLSLYFFSHSFQSSFLSSYFQASSVHVPIISFYFSLQHISLILFPSFSAIFACLLPSVILCSATELFPFFPVVSDAPCLLLTYYSHKSLHFLLMWHTLCSSVSVRLHYSLACYSSLGFSSIHISLLYLIHPLHSACFLGVTRSLHTFPLHTISKI